MTGGQIAEELYCIRKKIDRQQHEALRLVDDQAIMVQNSYLIREFIKEEEISEK